MLPTFTMKDTYLHRMKLSYKAALVIFVFALSLGMQDVRIAGFTLYTWQLLSLTLFAIVLLSFAGRVSREFGMLAKYGAFTMLTVFLFNLFLYTPRPTENLILKLPLFTLYTYEASLVLTDGALVNSLTQSLRLMDVLCVFSLFTLVQDPDAFCLSGRRFRRLGLLFMLTLRFYSVLSRDAKEITNAQRSRGLELDGKFSERLSNRSHVLLPLLQTSLERSVAVAEAMESRRILVEARNGK